MPFFYKKKSEPLFINKVKEYFDSLPPQNSSEIIFHLTIGLRQDFRTVRFRVPSGAFAAQNDPELLSRYLLARINNMLVTFGGENLNIYLDLHDRLLLTAVQKAVSCFDISNPQNTRTGLGSIINYINRMNVILGAQRFTIEYSDIKTFTPPSGQIFNILDAPACPDCESQLARAALELNGKVFCGMDVGGNSIKAALIADNEVLLLKTYAWFPALCATSEELINPIILLIRLMSAVYRYRIEHGALPDFTSILPETALYNELLDFTAALEQKLNTNPRVFDGIVIGFPDIIINDKIAGGETYKQRGIRNNPHVNYEDEFKKQSSLNIYAGAYTKEDGIVKVVTDSNVPSFTYSVEQALAQQNAIDPNGMLVFTIGTEMGTCIISRAGIIQRIPLECYNYIIDLGSDDYYKYDSNDLRSVNNFNSNIPGTVQKYISQIGLFRLSLKHIMRNNPGMLDILKEKGYLDMDTQNDTIYAVSKPKDMRSPLTRELIQMLKKGNNEIRSAFEDIGEGMGVLIEEISFMMDELSLTKLVSGGIVMDDACFETMVNGLHKNYPSYHIKRLDTDTVYSPLLRKLSKNDANYITAVGGIYIANRELINRKRTDK